MSEWRKIWANGLPDEGRSPESGYRMATEGILFPWRWNGGTISTDLDVIWGMSAQVFIRFEGEKISENWVARDELALFQYLNIKLEAKT